VKKINLKAKKEGNDPQFVKTVLYQTRLISESGEGGISRSIRAVNAEIAKANEPTRQVLYSILAELFSHYYSDNRYTFQNRTAISGVTDDSIETWDLSRLMKKTVNAYLKSLENYDLTRKIMTKDWAAIIQSEENENGSPMGMMRGGKANSNKEDENAPFTCKSCRPTLYDFLAWRALDFFLDGQSLMIVSSDRPMLNQPSLFMPAKIFATNRIMLPTDTSSPETFALKILRDLAAFHLTDPDPSALIDEEVQRFNLIKDKGTMANRDSLYLDAMEKLQKQFASFPESAEIIFTIASFHSDLGVRYKAGDSEKNQWELKKAVRLCDEAITQFPLSNGAAKCKNLKEQILSPKGNMTAEQAVIPAKPSLALLTHKNFKTVWFRLVKGDPEKYPDHVDGENNEDQLRRYLSLPVLKSWQETLPDTGDYQSHQAEMAVPACDPGYYILICSSGKDFTINKDVVAFNGFFSTSISYVKRKMEDGGYEVRLLDRAAGLPIKDASVELWSVNYNYNTRSYDKVKNGDYRSNADGLCTIPANASGKNYGSSYLKIRLKNELFVSSIIPIYSTKPAVEKPTMVTFFFTDRSIYRPGQVLYFKGIITEKNGGKHSIQPGVSTTVTLYDVNRSKIAEKSFVSNDFGSFNGSFTIPQGVLAGQMMITNNSGTAYFQVEEYKRPTFEVSFDPVEGNFKLGESITIKGKAVAYAGNMIDGAKVNFRVTRSARFPFWYRWWIPFPSTPEMEITNGTIKTESDGSFTIHFKAIPDALVGKEENPVFDYAVHADVTDLTGETCSTDANVAVGYNSLLISIWLPGKLNLLTDTIFKLQTNNLNGRPTPAKVMITFQRLKQPDRILKTRYWVVPDRSLTSGKEFHSNFPNDPYMDEDNPATWTVEQTVFQREYDTRFDTLVSSRQFAVGSKDGGWKMEDGKTFVPGNYLVTLKSIDPFGQPVEQKKWIVIFDPSSKNIPVKELNWFVPLITYGEPGEKARFLVGSAAEDVKVLYEVRLHDSLISQEWITLGNQQKIVEIPIIEKYRGNFGVSFTFVRYNRCFTNSATVEVPFTNKKLTIEASSFRNKLYPGQKEEWKFRISNAAKRGVNAEFLATMYDASLDVFRPHDFDFSILPSYYNYSYWESHYSFSPTVIEYIMNPLVTTVPVREKIYEQLNWFGYGFYNGYGIYRGHGRLKFSAPMVAMDAVMEDKAAPNMTLNETVVTSSKETKVVGGVKNLPGERSLQGPQIRRDFRETAFFYPSIMTDSAGDLSLKFTVPESLTRWKLLGFAHTRDLSYGLLEKEAVTRKDLMVFPNAPRFVRQGDTVVFSVKVTNMSDHELSGEVSLELFDGLTGKPFDQLLASGFWLLANDHKPAASDQQPAAFKITSHQSSSISWSIAIPVDASLSVLQYRVVAKAGNFSDGEEKAIPVLTNRMLVTESLPLPVKGNGTFNFSFDKLKNSNSSSLRNYNLTLEFASNPIWYAIQALPVLDEPKYPSADNIFYAFYANSIAFNIANSSPKVKAVFDSWKNQSPEALLSNLEKNESLKSALLKETPWVMEAKSESERKQRVALLFDLNTMSGRLDENLRKLQKMQKPGGGWCWFDGMPESRYTSQYIFAGLGHLDHLGILNIRNDHSTWNMILNAMNYLDGEILKDYQNIKRYAPGKMDENHLGSIQIQYLYTRSYFINSQKPEAKSQEAFNYFLKQATKYWLKQDLYCQGMIALALNRLGNKEVSKAILRSLSEKAIHSEEMGVYWANPAGYYWYQAPVETQALLIEAYDEISADTKMVDEMKTWLLKQKQTQDWKSNRATAEACYALLLKGSDWLGNPSTVNIQVGNDIIKPETLKDEKVEAGTGYFQKSWSGKEITQAMGSIKVEKDKDGIAWGALYWQYFEDLDKISQAQSPLKIEKELFVERNSKEGPVLEKITNYELRITIDTIKKTHQFTNSPVHQLQIGDKLKVRIILQADRNLEYIHLKDMRASAFEPLISESISGYRYQDGL
ncbi:MAG: alpha-2-macroglobulin family protein, partial [Bacteroidota bacterium]